jgi:hypothetical protein
MMTNQPHVIEIEILPDGQVKGEVKGVTGKSCTTLSAWLDEIGKVTVDRHTPDYNKPDKAMNVGQRKAG